MKRKIAIILLFTVLIVPCAQVVDSFNTTVWVPTLRSDNSIPDNYYGRMCPIPFWMSVETWLTELEWPYELENNVWDCSQTSAYTEWALENCGYEAEIILTTVLYRGVVMGHAYVRVKIDEIWHDIETTYRWIDNPRTGHIGPLGAFQPPDLVFPTIFRLYDFCRDKTVFIREFAWWER